MFLNAEACPGFILEEAEKCLGVPEKNLGEAAESNLKSARKKNLLLRQISILPPGEQ